MGLKAKFTKADIKKILAFKQQQLDQAIINRLTYVGEQFVKNARENHTYKDITGNLTSSIAYVILKNGQKLSENFHEAGKGSAKISGRAKAETFIDDLIANFDKGYVLIVVAGMEYAAAVEAKGKDVLTASSIQAKNDLKKAINEIRAKIN